MTQVTFWTISAAINLLLIVAWTMAAQRYHSWFIGKYPVADELRLPIYV